MNLLCRVAYCESEPQKGQRVFARVVLRVTGCFLSLSNPQIESPILYQGDDQLKPTTTRALLQLDKQLDAFPIRDGKMREIRISDQLNLYIPVSGPGAPAWGKSFEVFGELRVILQKESSRDASPAIIQESLMLVNSMGPDFGQYVSTDKYPRAFYKEDDDDETSLKVLLELI